MECLHFQDRFSKLFHVASNYSFKKAPSHNSPLALIVIILLHILLTIVVINSKTKPLKDLPFEAIMQLRELTSENAMTVSEPEVPTINLNFTPAFVAPPEINFKDAKKASLDLSLPQSDQLYEFPDEGSELYKDVFDPRLRKKLQEAYANRKHKKQNILNTWNSSGGTTFVDMGDGECIVSMPKIDSRQRGTSWSMLRVKCGKTDSEKMMDNVMADVEARKHPLKKNE